MSEHNVDLARRAFQAFADRNPGGLIALATDDIEFRPVTANLANDGMPYRGHEGLTRYFQDVERVWTDLRLFPEDYRDLGDTVVVLGRMHGHGGGMIFDRPTGWVWRIRDGRIASVAVFGSHEEAIAAAGGERDR